MSVEATLKSRNLIVSSLCLENHSERATFNCDLERCPRVSQRL